MKIVVIGGTGLIGAKLISKLKEKGHKALAASPSTGVNTITGEGLARVLEGANVVVDVSNAPSFEDKAVLEFFETSSRNLLKAEQAAGVSHHIILSVVGVDLHPEGGYFKAKLAQEKLVKLSGIPYTIIRATQFFEFLNSIVESGAVGQTVRLPTALVQPIASDDVGDALLQVTLEMPKNGTLEIAGPERFRCSDLVELYLKATNDPRKVIPDANAQYFGIKLNDNSLVPQKKAQLGSINFEKWFNSQRKK